MQWFRQYQDVQRRRGLLLIDAAFPRVVVAVCVPQLRPYVVLFGAVIDYTNWDIEPPSVSIVDPFTLEPLLGGELITYMRRRAPLAPGEESTNRDATPDVGRATPVFPETVAPACDQAGASETPPVAPVVEAVPPAQQLSVSLLQFSSEEDVPFLCLAGVREYHEHPAHTGDSWWLHRRSGAASLSHLLNAFHTYAIAPITGFAPNVALRRTPAGVEVHIGELTLATDIPA